MTLESMSRQAANRRDSGADGWVTPPDCERNEHETGAPHVPIIVIANAAVPAFGGGCSDAAASLSS